jgi:predicted metal-dependent hydrolase
MTPRLGIQQRILRFGSREIHYGLSYGDHRDLVISVTPDLKVLVSAPRPATTSEIEAKVLAKAPWILRHQLRYQDMHPLPLPRRYVPGETHLYLGRQYRLRIEQGESDGVRLQRPFLVVIIDGQQREEDARRLVKEWYRARAERFLPKRLQIALEAHPSLRCPNIRMQVRTMSKRWGSCSRSGLLSFNPELLRAPTACIDYVVVHELCHKRVMNHGPEFQRLIGRVMPDWRKLRGRLNKLPGE